MSFRGLTAGLVVVLVKRSDKLVGSVGWVIGVPSVAGRRAGFGATGVGALSPRGANVHRGADHVGGRQPVGVEHPLASWARSSIVSGAARATSIVDRPVSRIMERPAPNAVPEGF